MLGENFHKFVEENPCLRFGQAFCVFHNVYKFSLFIVQDKDKAISIIEDMAKQYQWEL